MTEISRIPEVIMPRKSPKSRKKQTKPQNAPQSPAKRDTLRLLRNGAVGVVALGGLGLVSVRAVRATMAEQDLSVIGTGVPTIVQIHDPQCSMCTELQRETRKALRAFSSDDVAYRIASIRTDEGAAFAAYHGQPHVTLMLFNGSGDVQNVLTGVRQAEELQGHFQALLRQTTPRS